MSKETISALVKPVDEDDHVKGPPSASVTLVEYGDFQCEDTGAAYSIVKKLLSEFGDRMRFVYRHFPLVQIHQYAEHAAEAAESAAQQGMFWEMYDYLFQHQDDLEDTTLMDAAEEMGLNVDEFDQDLVAGVFKGHIRDDVRSGIASGIDETPAFFINGERYKGPVEYNSIKRAIEQAELLA